jgi:hypothetical protein
MRAGGTVPRRSSAGDLHDHLKDWRNNADLARTLMAVSPNTSASDAESDLERRIGHLLGPVDPRRSALGDPIGSPTAELHPVQTNTAAFRASLSPLFVKEPVLVKASSSLLTEALMPVDLTPTMRRNTKSFASTRALHKHSSSDGVSENSIPQKALAAHIKSREKQLQAAARDAEPSDPRRKRVRHHRSSSLQDTSSILNGPDNAKPQSGYNTSGNGGIGAALNRYAGVAAGKDVGLALEGDDDNRLSIDDSDSMCADELGEHLDKVDENVPGALTSPGTGRLETSVYSSGVESDVLDEGRVWQVTQMLASATVGDVIRGIVRLCNMKGGAFSLLVKPKISDIRRSSSDNEGRKSVVLAPPPTVHGPGEPTVAVTSLGDGLVAIPHGLDQHDVQVDAISSAAAHYDVQPAIPTVLVNRDGLAAQVASSAPVVEKALPSMFELRALDGGEPDLDVPELDRMQSMTSLGESHFGLCRVKTHEFLMDIRVESGNSSRGAAVLIISFRRPGGDADSTASGSPTMERENKHVTARLQQQEQLLRQQLPRGTKPITDSTDSDSDSPNHKMSPRTRTRKATNAGAPLSLSDDSSHVAGTAGAGAEEDISFDEWYRREYGAGEAEAPAGAAAKLDVPTENTAEAAIPTDGDVAAVPDSVFGAPPEPPSGDAAKKTILGLPLASFSFWPGKSAKNVVKRDDQPEAPAKAAEKPEKHHATAATAAAHVDADDDYAGDVDETPPHGRKQAQKHQWAASSILRTPRAFFFGGKAAPPNSAEPSKPTSCVDGETPPSVGKAPLHPDSGPSFQSPPPKPPGTASKGRSFMSAFTAFSPAARKAEPAVGPPPLTSLPSEDIHSMESSMSSSNPAASASTSKSRTYFSNFWTPKSKKNVSDVDVVLLPQAETVAPAPPPAPTVVDARGLPRLSSAESFEEEMNTETDVDKQIDLMLATGLPVSYGGADEVPDVGDF